MADDRSFANGDQRPDRRVPASAALARRRRRTRARQRRRGSPTTPSGSSSAAHRDQTEPAYRLPFDVDPEEVAEAGWAIVFSDDEDAEVRAELDALVEHRRSRLGDENVKVLDYQPGERWAEWLDRHGTAPGNVDPEKVPYYVLLAGEPDADPLQLPVPARRRVRRRAAELRRPGGYAGYVRGARRLRAVRRRARDAAATFFGTRHQYDEATQLSADSLVVPLADSFRSDGRFGRSVTRVPRRARGGRACDEGARSTQILAGSGPVRPAGAALLRHARHGRLARRPSRPDRASRRPALPGLARVGQISQKHYFAGSDLPADARVHGLVAFFFACFAAGTPQ